MLKCSLQHKNFHFKTFKIKIKDKILTLLKIEILVYFDCYDVTLFAISRDFESALLLVFFHAHI